MRYSKRTFVPAPIGEVFDRCASLAGFLQQFPFKVKWRGGPERWGRGDKLDFQYRLLGLWIPHCAEVVEFRPNDCFVDEMTRGLYKYCRHTHKFTKENNGTWVQDEVEFSLGFGFIVDKFIGMPTLESTFKKRHNALLKYFQTEDMHGR